MDQVGGKKMDQVYRTNRVNHMMSNFTFKTSNLKMDERNHVEKPLLGQLAGLGWEILDLDNKQHPDDAYRETFSEVVMLPVLRERFKSINHWLEDDQVEEVVKQLTASFRRSFP